MVHFLESVLLGTGGLVTGFVEAGRVGLCVTCWAGTGALGLVEAPIGLTGVACILTPGAWDLVLCCLIGSCGLTFVAKGLVCGT